MRWYGNCCLVVSVTDSGGFAVSLDALAAHPDFDRLATVLQAPQAALRARVNAVILDLILLGIASQLVAPALTSKRDVSGRALVFLAREFAYLFVFELRSGQTIGKRIFHVRVVTADGSPATVRQIALRNALRIFDSLPFFYASGLISLIRTGPARRQRIGDVAARTTVVLDPGGKALRTPSWLLPALTLLATVLSLAIIIPALSNRHQTAGPIELRLQDRLARMQARTAAVAAETYAVEHNGYSGLTVSKLEALEPTLRSDPGARLSASANSESYTVTSTSIATGDAFSITRTASGTLEHTCTPPGSAACPPTGMWDLGQ
jgi:uncharacterized RDD family membrane protein YckC